MSCKTAFVLDKNKYVCKFCPLQAAIILLFSKLVPTGRINKYSIKCLQSFQKCLHAYRNDQTSASYVHVYVFLKKLDQSDWSHRIQTTLNAISVLHLTLHTTNWHLMDNKLICGIRFVPAIYIQQLLQQKLQHRIALMCFSYIQYKEVTFLRTLYESEIPTLIARQIACLYCINRSCNFL